MRHIGVDLHKTNFVVCFLSDDERTHTETYPLTKVGIHRFITRLEAEDAVAVEVTANIYYFYDQVRPHVSRVVLVDTYRFAVIARSKKTVKADAAALARFLKLDYLPSVAVPSERVRQLRHLLQARETLVGMRTKLKNMGHGALTRNGLALSRSAFASKVSRARLAKREELAPADTLIMQAALRQIEELDREVAVAHGCHQRRAVDGQSHEDTAHGVLPTEEKRERGRQGDLCDGTEITDDYLRDAEEGVGLLVFGRSLIQSQVAGA